MARKAGHDHNQVLDEAEQQPVEQSA